MRRVRTTLINAGVFLVMIFWSSPLAMLSAISAASDRLNLDSVWHFHAILTWVKVR